MRLGYILGRKISMEREYTFRKPRSRRIARLCVSETLLADLVGLPDDCKIIDIQSFEKRFNVWDIVIESKYLREISEGEIIPFISKTDLDNIGYDE
jgi:hypothetical protein